MKQPLTWLAAAGAGAAGGALLVLRSPERRVRTERTLRVWRLTARRGARWAEMKARGSRASDERRTQLEEQFVIKSAEDVAQVLGGMKGAIMKAGQMFSFIAEGLPTEAAKALQALQADVAPMAPSLAERVITEELGLPPEKLFLDWEPVPVAAASIGQVHRAVLRDGRKVAVKVQYPGVDDAIRADLSNAQLLYTLFSQFALPNLDVKAMVDEIRQRMVEELDYRLEAKSQDDFAQIFVGHPFIKIPAVVTDLSTQRVLTTEWVDGQRWDDFLKTASSEAKNRAGEGLMRFAQGCVYHLRMFNGDPHPGNYRFHADGSITFLDFGLVKRWTSDEVAQLTPLLDGVIEQDADALVAHMESIGCIVPGHGLDPEKVLDYVGTAYAPFLVPSFKYSREYMKTALAKVVDVEGRYKDILQQLDLPTSYVILDRLVWGIGSILAYLETECPWGSLLEEYRHGAPPSTELGRQEHEWRLKRAAEMAPA